MKALVLGVGNILLADEGVGVRVVEALQQGVTVPEGVEILDGGTMGLELLPYLEDRSHLFIVDAVKSGAAPGTIIRKELDDPPAFFRTKISPHQIGLSELLSVASMTDALPANIVLFGMEPANLDTGLDMSPEVEANIGALVDMVVDELKGLGFNFDDGKL